MATPAQTPYGTWLPRYDFNTRLYGILTVAGFAGTLLVLPYALTLQAPLIDKLPRTQSLEWLLKVQMVQNFFLMATVVGLGLLFAWRTGLGAPILEGWLAGEDVREARAALLGWPVVAGILASIAVIALDVGLFAKHLPKLADVSAAQPPAWQGFLASFYGGITEELLLRLGVMSFFAWLGGKVLHDERKIPTPAVFWLANVLAAVIFGLGHLPATAALMPLTKLVVARAVVSNGLAGIVFGWFYWRRGLESAMVSHFSGDLVLHVLLPLAAGIFH